MARRRRLKRGPYVGALYYPTDEARHGAGGVRRRLYLVFLVVTLVVLSGTLGYWILGQGRWSMMDCAYMVVLTITTIGYGEHLPIHEVRHGPLFTMFLMVVGASVSIYALSSVTAFIIEGDLGEVLWRRKMRRRLESLSDHFIVCGAGQTGGGVVEHLLNSGVQVVVIDKDPVRLEWLQRRVRGELFGVVGDATEDLVLQECGLARACGIVASLQTDQDNLFVTLTARQAHPGIRIVSRAVEERSASKLLHAGANTVVSPNNIGGRRMAHEMLKPSVVGFMDLIVNQQDHTLTVGECPLPPLTHLNNVPLAMSRIREVANVLVLSVLWEDKYQFNPAPDFILKAGMTLIVLGERSGIETLTQFVAR
ncbi:NAD-binding protein [Myxococcota bacterium]|nr:NAD-binding protein [Myxococcota bacterium]MBU1431408.1 NAD-binding protein [Myxococcota bacterium]MBU1898527.1 NAD-binding protein [Myxococcota bacterium]